ncbi:DNA repair protein xrcc4 [Ranunculus cassubicifolius]
MDSSTRHTCLRLQLTESSSSDIIFIKGTWFPSHFSLSITDGLTAWICNASEIEVQERADQWDQPVKDYIETAERYLGFRQPGSNYNFVDAGSGHKRLSWTFQKEGIKLEWRWKCRPSTNDKKTTSEILDFLMDANIRLSEEVVRKTQSFDKLKVEAEKCLAQSEKFSCEKAEFESAVYAKFVAVLNSKKAKLRELRDGKQDAARKLPEEEDDVSTEKTESYNGETDNDKSEEETADSLAGTSTSVPATRQGRKRKTHK